MSGSNSNITRVTGRQRPLLQRSCILAALLIALAVVTAAPPAAATEPVKGEVSVVLANGFARLVFRLSEEVESEVKVSNGVVVIAFKQPVAIAVDRIAANALGYIGAARRDPDGMGIRLALASKVTVNSMAAGERLFVDLLPEPWTGMTPGLPQDAVDELARRARDAEKRARLQLQVAQQRKQSAIRVRIGRQPTFTRYVFDLPAKVGVSNDRSKDQLTLIFDAPLRFDLADVQAELPRTVESVESETDTDTVSVRFAFAGRVDVRTFREGNNYVVDVAPAAAKKPGEGIEGEKPSDESMDTEQSASRDEAARRAEASAPVKMPAPDPQAPPAAAAAQSSAAPAPPVEPPPSVDQPAEKPPSAPAAVEKDKVTRAPAGPIVADVTRQGDSLRVTFPFARPTPAAVFRRADTLWMVFDFSSDIDLSALNADASRTIRNASLIPIPNGTALRVKLERPRLTSLTAEGTGWVVTIGETVQEPTRPLALTRSIAGPTRSSVIIPFEDPRQIHQIADPEVGDTLFVVTALGPARGFLKTQDFVEFHALASTHGVVIQPIADDLNPELAADKVVVGRPAGLSLSGGAHGAQRGRGPGSVVLDPQTWGFDRQADFIERQALLLRTAAEASEHRRAAARLDLARFYLAREMDVEAKAVLDVALANERPTADDAPALVLRAVANILLERADDALRDLSAPFIGNQHDAPLWRALARARQGKFADAREGFKNVAVSIATLPIELQRLALLEAVRASIEVRDFAGGANLLNELETIGVPRELEPKIAVLIGRLAEGLGRAEDALVAYHRAAESRDRPSASQGRLREIQLRYAVRDLKRAQALEALESLTTLWRGDDTEIEALQLMARFYTEESRYREAFHVMRTALTAHPNSELTRRIHDEAALTFDSLFLAGKGDGLPTIDALSLFYDFRELTPIGRRGDEMIRRLADRLVAVDLLDQAAELLQYQVDHRLQGAGRAQVSTRLAVIYLMNRKADRALATLRATRTADLTNEVRNQRLLIEARALSDIGRHDVALEVIANVEGREAVRLRSDILWAAKRWNEAAEQLELLYGNRWQEWEPLTSIERADILRAAIGFALGDDSIGLGRFREKYGPKMAESADRRSFEVVTAPTGTAGAEFRDVAKAVAAVDTLDSFLRDLRSRYPETGSVAPAGATAAPGEAPPAAPVSPATRAGAQQPGLTRQAAASR